MDKNRFKLSFLLFAAAIPIALSSWYFDWQESEGVKTTTNKGQLIVPVLDITDFGLEDSKGDYIFDKFEVMVANINVEDYTPRPWLIMYLGSEECNTKCEERLHILRQLHTRLSGESDRVERYYVNANNHNKNVTTNTLSLFESKFPELKIANSNKDVLLDNLSRTVTEGLNPAALHYIYIVDPVGNVMLYFTEENTVEDIYKDLDKLLDQSSLG